MMKTIPNLNPGNATEKYGTEIIEAAQSLPAFGFTTIEADMIGLPLVKKVTPIRYFLKFPRKF